MPEWEGEHRAIGGRAESLSSSATVFRNPDDDKENLPPWRSLLSGRLKRAPKRSPLPSWYPRTPLRDITAVFQAIEKRRARRREMERLRMEQNKYSAPPEEVARTEPCDSRKPDNIPVMPEISDPCPWAILTPETGYSTVTNFSETPDVATVKGNAANLVAAGIGTPLGPTTPDVIADNAPVMHEISVPGPTIITPGTGSATVTNFLETPDAEAVKQNAASLFAAGIRTPVGPTTPSIIADRVTNIDSCTPESAALAEKSMGLVATCDRTPASEVIAENWWLKPRADTSNVGGVGVGVGIKKNSVLQQRSKVCLMR